MCIRDSHEIILAAPVYPADHGDCLTLADSLTEARLALEKAELDEPIEELVADKGYHSAASLELVGSLGVRTYIPEPKAAHKRRWTDKEPEFKQAVYGNRRRTRTKKNKRLQRLRSERVERSFAHVCETGGARKTWLRGQQKVAKRHLTAAMAHNLGVIMRNRFGIGTPRQLQGLAAIAALAYAAQLAMRKPILRIIATIRQITYFQTRNSNKFKLPKIVTSSTGC